MPVPTLFLSAFFFPTPPSRAESRAPPGCSTLCSLSRLLRAPPSPWLEASELSRPPRSRNPSAAGRFSGARERCALARGRPAAGAEVLALPQMSGTHARAVRIMGTLIKAKLRFLAARPRQRPIFPRLFSNERKTKLSSAASACKLTRRSGKEGARSAAVVQGCSTRAGGSNSSRATGKATERHARAFAVWLSVYTRPGVASGCTWRLPLPAAPKSASVRGHAGDAHRWPAVDCARHRVPIIKSGARAALVPRARTRHGCLSDGCVCPQRTVGWWL